MLLWYEAIGKNAEDFAELKRKFLCRYWNRDKQSEVIRSFYSNNHYRNSGMSMEQYLLSASGENKQLDSPLTEKSLVGAICRQFSVEIAKHVMMTGIDTVEEFAEILSSWEELEREHRREEKGVIRQEVISNRYENQNNRINGQERIMNNGEIGNFNYRQYNRDERYSGNNMGHNSGGRIRNYGEGNRGYRMNQNNMKEKGKWEDRGRTKLDEKEIRNDGENRDCNTRDAQLN